jgi:AAA+ ATPase superfamily predicted ATPase
MATLIDLGYVLREVPFNESTSSTKRTLYRLQDPFLEFWYRFVPPNRSMLELGRVEEIYEKCRHDFAGHTGGIWEHLCRMSTAFLDIGAARWEVASRWWGTDLLGIQREIDVVARSLDGDRILLGEAKWEQRTDVGRVFYRLSEAAKSLPFTPGRKVSYAVWVPEKRDLRVEGCEILDAGDVMRALR